MIRDKEGTYIMIKGSIPQEAVSVFNRDGPNNRVRICEAKMDRITRRNKPIHYDSNTPLSEMDRSSTHKISKDVADGKSTSIDCIC